MAEQAHQSTGNAGEDDNCPASGRVFLSQLAMEQLNDTQRGFINSIRLLEANEDLIGSTLLEEVADMFPPAILFSKDLCELPAVFTELRNFLDSRGTNMHQHSSRRIMMTLATNIYNEPEDTDAATAIVTEIMAAGKRMRGDLSRLSEQRSQSTRSNNTPHPSSSSTDKIARNVAMRLKDRDKKFSAALGESWMEFVDEYLQIGRDYSLSPTQKLQYMHNILSGDAKRYYLDRIDGYATSFQQAVELIEREYNSPVRQARVKNYLNQLRLNTIEAEGMEESAALAKLYRIITKLSRQAPSSHRGDAHKLEFLLNAVVGSAWSREPLSRVATHNLSFQQLYGELEAALQLEKETKHAALRDSMTRSSSRRFGHDEEIPGILFTGQTRYAKHPSSLGYQNRTGFGKPTKGMKFDPLSISGCFNCDDPTHVVKNCPKTLNVAKAAAKKLEYYSKKDKMKEHAVHVVLAELCTQLDMEEEGMGGIGDDMTQISNDREIFENLLCSFSQVNVNLVELSEPLEGNKCGTGIEDEDLKIYLIKAKEDLPNPSFLGARIDTGAQKSVIGTSQAKAYSEFMNSPYRLRQHAQKMSFKFGNKRHNGLGEVEIRIPVDGDFFLSVWIQVVDVNIPLLLGLDFLDAFGMNVNASRDVMESEERKWSFPLVRKLGHLYYEWVLDNYYTAGELRKIHRHFFHPESGRLYAVLRRAHGEGTTPETMGELEKLASECEICQRNAASPNRFRVSLPPEDIVFNRVVCMDIMSLSGKTVLHMIDRDTKFSVAEFMRNESAEETWKLYMRAWVTTFVGYSDEIHGDQGPQFRSKEFKSYAKKADVKLILSGVESHNSLGVGERYHSYLRKVYTKVRDEFPNIDLEYSLKLAVKAMKDTAGQNGLVPTLLVFGVMPRIPVARKDLPGMMERMQAMEAGRKDMADILARNRISKAVQSNVPAAADKEIAIGSKVLVFKEKPINKWIGPFEVRDVKKKVVFVDMDGRLSQLSIDKVKTYTPPPKDALGEMHPLEPETGGANDYDTEMKVARQLDPLEDLFAEPNQLNDPLSTDEFYVDLHNYITEVVDGTDPRSNTEAFRVAKEQEIDGLKKRGTWKIIKEEELEQNANVLGGRFVLALKNAGTDREQPKARFVAQGFADKEKDFLIHNISSLRQSSVRVILSFAANMEYRIFTHDVTQAYTQSDDPLSRKIYRKPKAKDRQYFGLEDDQILQLVKPIYGTTDVGDYWDVTVENHVKNDLEMEPMTGDPSLYGKFVSKQDIAAGLLGMLVDDGLLTGSEAFQKLTEMTLERFESRVREWDNVEFFGMKIERENGNVISIYQPNHIERLTVVEATAPFSKLRSVRAAIAWIAYTRPDILCLVNKLAQVTVESYTREHIKMMNGCIKLLKMQKGFKIQYAKLDLDSVHLRVYTDAAFGTNNDSTSQIGFVILLCDKEDNAHILDYASKKARRVVRSIMGGEFIAFAEGFDRAWILKHYLDKIYHKNIRINMLTDSKQLFDVIMKGSTTAEKGFSLIYLPQKKRSKRAKLQTLA